MNTSVSKDLKDMALEELWQLFLVELVAHRCEWRQWAADEIRALSELLSAWGSVISHIGSTAIPGIFAKPIVDLLVEVPADSDRSRMKTLLEHNGYICMSESSCRMSFNKGYTPDGFADKVFHVHVRMTGDRDEIYFRDYLLSHKDVAKQYERLKLSLLPRFKHNRDAYTDAKTDFVKRITTIAKTEKRL